MTKLVSPSCERNGPPILNVLRHVLPAQARVLEIGSGTGQHAVLFGAAMPGVIWQTSDLPDNHPSIRAWIDDSGLSNVLPPITLDMREPVWPATRFDVVFTSNTLHIMGWKQVETLFAGLPQVLAAKGLFIAYGPFNEGGRFTSASNADFDAMLRAQSSTQGIRDKEAVDALAAVHGLQRVADDPMPANNRLMRWQMKQ